MLPILAQRCSGGGDHRRQFVDDHAGHGGVIVLLERFRFLGHRFGFCLTFGGSTVASARPLARAASA